MRWDLRIGQNLMRDWSWEERGWISARTDEARAYVMR